MIQLLFMHPDGSNAGKTNSSVVPRKGEAIWIVKPNGTRQPFRVADVAYVAPDVTADCAGYYLDRVNVYVVPIGEAKPASFATTPVTGEDLIEAMAAAPADLSSLLDRATAEVHEQGFVSKETQVAILDAYVNQSPAVSQ